jgi:hypothetical protein
MLSLAEAQAVENIADLLYDFCRAAATTRQPFRSLRPRPESTSSGRAGASGRRSSSF